MNTCINYNINQYLAKCVLSLFNWDMFSLSINTVNWCMVPIMSLWVIIKTLTRLGYTMTSSIYIGSNSIFNDNVSDKTHDSFTHNESNFHCEGWGNWVVSSLMLKIFWKVRKKGWYKVRYFYEMYWINSAFKY